MRPPSLAPSLLAASSLLCACAGPDAAGQLAGVPRSPAAEEPAARLLAPVVSPEIALDAPVSSPNPHVQGRPGIASGAGQNLAVWVDRRDGELVHAARVAPDGGVLDPIGIRVGPGASPAAASDGASFLVVSLDPADTHLRGARVTAGGEVLDPDGFDISPAAGAAPAIAFDGASYLIARTIVGSIELARVSPDGVPLGVEALIVPDVYNIAELGLDCGGGICLLAWADNGQAGIRAARVDAQGAVLDPGGFAVGPSGDWQPLGPGVAHDGADFVVTWVSRESAGLSRVLAARVTPAGAVLDPAGVEIDTAPLNTLGAPRAAFDGAATALLWRAGLHPTQTALRHARLAPDGTPAGAPVDLLTLTPASYGIAPRGDGAHVIWTQDNTFTWTSSLFGARVDAAGALVDAVPRPIAIHANDQVSPTAAFDGQHYIIAYTDHRDGAQGIHAARLTPTGELADPEGIAIGADGEAPEAIFDGSSTLIAWWPPDCTEDGTCTYRPSAVRLSPEGVVLDPVPLSLPVECFIRDLALASDGQGTFVLTRTLAGLALTRVGQDGAVSATQLNIQEDLIGAGSLGLAYGGESLLAVWRSTTDTIMATRVTPAGEVLDAPRSISTLGPEAGISRTSPAVSFDGRSYVVLWSEHGPDDGAGHTVSVKMIRVSPEGEVLDPDEVTLASDLLLDVYLEPSPTIAFDGRASIATWQRIADPSAGTFASDLHGAVIDTEGAVLYDFTISPEPRNEGPPALAAAAGGALVAYSRYAPEAPFGAQRVQARLITVADDGTGGTGGAGGAGGGPLGLDDMEEQDAGCGCEAAGASTRGGGALALLCALLAARGRGRRGRRGMAG